MQPTVVYANFPGRHPSSDYVINHLAVSGKHCTIHAVLADTGTISIVCQDSSKYGIVVNGHSFKGHQSILLMDGDKLELPNSQIFTCENVANRGRYVSQPQGTQVGIKSVGSYTITNRKLGSGAYSSVLLAIDRSARRQAACKTIVRKTQADIADVLREVQLLQKLNHPNINAIFDFETSGEHLYIFLELATGGDLFSYMAKNGTLCEGEAKFISYQLMQGLVYIHSKGMAHRDLKPENVLLANPGQYPRVLIADFGLAKERAFEPTGNVAGTVSYLPPEAVMAITLKNKYSTEGGDSWSLGVIIFIMLQGFHPFDPRHTSTQVSLYPVNNLGQELLAEHSEELVRRRIVQKQALFDPDQWLDLTLARDLISKLLVQDIKARQTARESLEHSWIKVDETSLSKAHKKLVASR